MISYQPIADSTARIPRLRTLLRLTKPGIVILLVLTGVMTALAAGNPWLTWSDWFAFIAAGALTAGGAGALNHVLDRDLDGLMARTALRPLPAGDISSSAAAVWGSVLCASGLLISLVQLPWLATWWIAAGLLIYIPLYTMVLKRRTPWAVVIGGGAGCCPILAGWALARGDWPLLPWGLALAVFFWTPAHFWAYAIAHLENYRAIGLPVLPVKAGVRNSLPMILVTTAATAVSAPLVLTGVPLIIAMISGGLLMGLCVDFCRTPDRERGLRFYRVSNYYLALIFLSLVAL